MLQLGQDRRKSNKASGVVLALVATVAVPAVAQAYDVAPESPAAPAAAPPLLQGVAPVPTASPAVTAIDGERFADTRAEAATIDDLFEADGAIATTETYEVTIAGRGSVPADATGALINVAAVNPDADGYLTVFDCDGAPPNASALNYTTGVTIANEITVKLSATGSVCVYSLARTHVLLDVVGHTAATDSITSMSPKRFGDSRPGFTTFDNTFEGFGRTAAGSTTKIHIAGRGGVPADINAAIVNVAVVGPTSDAYVTVHPCLPTRPVASSINHTAGVTRANELVTGVDANGDICVYTHHDVDFIVDVNGYVEAGSDLVTVANARLADTRDGHPTIDGQSAGGGQVAAASTTKVQITGRAGVPDDAVAAIVNLTAVDPDDFGYLTAESCNSPRPFFSSLNYVPGVTGANELLIGLDNAGSLCVYSRAATDFLIDVVGFVKPHADLSITKISDADPSGVVAGETITYTIEVTNDGPHTATGIEVTDILPSGVTLVATTGCTEDPAGAPICTLADLAAGESASYTTEVTVDAGISGSIGNLARVDSDTGDTDLLNNTASTTATALPTADLSITKADDVDPVVAGDTIVYNVEVTNDGPQDATNVVVTDTLPAGLTFASTTGCAEDPAGAPTCTLGTITNGGAASYTIEVTVDAAVAGSLTNAASVTSDTHDPNLADNTVTEDTTADPTADLSITKSDSPDPVATGTTLTYTVEVTNDGPQDATDVVVTDTLPAGVTLASTTGCAEDPAGAPTCSLGTITNGASASYTIDVTVDLGTLGTIDNQVEVTSDTHDPNTLNNSFLEDTTVFQTGTIEVVKDFIGTAGLVNLGIDMVPQVTDVGDGGTTGAVTVSTGDHFASEAAGTGTDLADYGTAYSCVEDSNGASPINGSGTSTANIPVEEGDAWTCTFTNTFNPPPVVTPSAGTTAFTEDAGAVTVDGAVTVTDAVDTNLASATVTITNLLDGADETLSCAACPVGGITATYTAGVLTLTGPGTVANFQTALQSVTYDNSSGNLTTTDRIIRFVASDALADSNNGDKTVSVTGVNDPPTLVAPAAFDSLGNVGISVPAANGLLTGATITDPDYAGPFTIETPYATTSTNSGTVSISADGSFTYTPAPGFGGSDTFTYAVCDNGTPTPAECSTAATVTITVGDAIWFVDNTGAAGNGTLASPFNSLAQFNASALDGVGDTIFIDTGTGLYPDGITSLLVGQQVIGEGATVPLAIAAGITVPPYSEPLPTTGGTRPTIGAIGVSADNTIRGLDVNNAAPVPGIGGNGVGTLTVSEVAVTSAISPALDLDNGTMNLDLTGVTVTSSPSGGIDLTAVGAGSTINLAALNVTTIATGTGLNVTGGGTLMVTGATNTITTSQGVGVNLVNTTIGGSGPALSGTDLTGTFGVIFQSVSVGNGTTGPVNGIVLDNAGAGGFTITGTGGNGSGGTLQDTTGDAIILRNGVQNVELTNIVLDDIGRHGVSGVGVTNLVVNNSQFTDIGNAPTESAFAFNTDTGAQDNNIAGQLTLNNVDITRFFENGINIFAESGSVNVDVINGSDFVDNADTAGLGQAIIIETEGTAGADLNVNGSLFDDVETDAVRFEAGGSGTNNTDVTGNTVTDPGGPDNFPNGGSFHMIVTDAATLSFDIQGNVQNDLPGDGIIVAATSGGGNITGRIGGPNPADGNIINGGVDAGGFPSSDGILVTDIGVDATIAETMTLLIQNNTINTNNGDDGIQFSVGDNNGTYNITISDNTVSNTASEGIRFFFDDDNLQSPTLNLDVADNSFIAIGDGAIELATRDSGVACANVTGNGNGAGGSPGTILLDERDASAIDITQASTAALSAANNGATITVQTNAVGFNATCATSLPSHS